jgi:hypothetical protein
MKYYEEYLITHEKVMKRTGKDKDGTSEPSLHNWRLSGARYNFYKEAKYRGWFGDEIYEIYEEAMRTVREVERKCNNFVKYEWEARVPDCREPCGILTTDINQFIYETIRKWIEDTNYYHRDELVFEACNDFAESTCVMVWKEFYEDFNDNAILEFFTNEERRNNMMNRMASVERVGRHLSEIDRRVNMNATPEDFAKYLKNHNISITEEMFEEFKLMNRFKSFSKYIREHRVRMGLKVFLAGDKKVAVSDVKNAKAKPIEVVRNNAVNKMVILDSVKEPVKNIEIRKTVPIKVVRCNCSKELVIVKKDKEIIEIPATKKEAIVDVQIATMKEEKETDLEKKVNELRNVIIPDNVELNVLENNEAGTKKKEPLAFSFGASDKRSIEVSPRKKVDDREEVPEPEIIKENDEYKVIRKIPLTDVQIELRKDDPVIPISKDLSCPEKKKKEEDKI